MRPDVRTRPVFTTGLQVNTNSNLLFLDVRCVRRNRVSAVLPLIGLVRVPAQHSRYNAQKPKFSVRWQPLDPKWIGALILRGSYSEAFHAPTLPDLTPAGIEGTYVFGLGGALSIQGD
jgi:outer membrane receptor protein involved in Fe transport